MTLTILRIWLMSELLSLSLLPLLSAERRIHIWLSRLRWKRCSRNSIHHLPPPKLRWACQVRSIRIGVKTSTSPKPLRRTTNSSPSSPSRKWCSHRGSRTHIHMTITSSPTDRKMPLLSRSKRAQRRRTKRQYSLIFRKPQCGRRCQSTLSAINRQHEL